MRWKGISIGIAHIPNTGMKVKHPLLMENEKSINPLVFVGWPYFPYWKEENSPSCLQELSEGSILLFIGGMSIRACGRKPMGIPLPVPTCACAQSPASATLAAAHLPLLGTRHHPCEWQGLAAPAEFLCKGFSF